MKVGDEACPARRVRVKGTAATCREIGGRGERLKDLPAHKKRGDQRREESVAPRREDQKMHPLTAREMVEGERGQRCLRGSTMKDG